MHSYIIVSHNLEIERGRFTKPKTPEEFRICKHCNLNAVDNEYHFLLICPFHDHERSILIHVIEENVPTLIIPNNVLDTFYNLMLCENNKINFSMGKYIHKCFRKRLL